jgi:tetratricopeptide (TPR) repeat protein
VLRTYAEICLRTERYQEALEIYEQLLASGVASTANRLQLAWLYTQGKEMESAFDVIAALLDEGHRQWEVLSTYGGVASELGNYQELARVSQLMREIYPDSTGGYTGLAIAKSYRDDLKGAIAVMEEAVARFPAHTDVNYLLGRLYYDAERYKDAEGPLLGALAGRPSARYIKRILASTWASLEKFRVSDSLYEVLLLSDHDDPVTLNNYAYSLADRANPSRKQLKIARKMSKRSLKLQPGNSSFLDTYGWIWYQLGRYRKARKYIAQSLEVKGDNAIVLDHFGDVYLELGDRDQAEKYFQQAREIRESGQPTEVRASDE